MSLHVDIRKKLGSFSLDMKVDFPDAPTAVIGPSGSGKSLLLRCIAGIAAPDSGRICSNGAVWYDTAERVCLPPQRRRAGYLFQQYALFENKTVRGNIEIGMPGTKWQKRQESEQLMERFQLTALAELHPSQLSGGQRQRTALARMLGAQPNILLLDEPFSALDTHLRGQVHRQMADVLAQHAGVSLLVTHDFAEAVQLCPRAAVVSGGRIVETGACMELWEHPRTRVCAELTGMRNFFPVPAHMAPDASHAYCLGIRAERFRPAREGDTMIFSGTVRRVLPGIQTHQVTLDTPQGELVWEVPRAADMLPQPGEELTLSAEQANIHMLRWDKF